MGRIVGACEDCRKGFGKWGGLWMLVKTVEGILKCGHIFKNKACGNSSDGIGK